MNGEILKLLRNIKAMTTREDDYLWFKEVKHGKYVIRFWRTTGGWISELITDEFLKDLQNETT